MRDAGIAGPLFAVMARDLRVAFRRWSDLGNAVLFFVLVVALFPLASSPRAEFLLGIAPGVLWIAALLSSLLSLNLLFRADMEDGTMEQLLSMPLPLAWIMLGKIASHWLVTGLPLVLMAPVLALTYHLPAAAMDTLVLSLLLGTPTLSLVGAVGAALTAGLRQAGVLLALMVTPLMLPVLMLGARATDLAVSGEDPTGPLYLLAALLALALSLVPLTVAAAVRISVD